MNKADGNVLFTAKEVGSLNVILRDALVMLRIAMAKPGNGIIQLELDRIEAFLSVMRLKEKTNDRSDE